MTKAYEKRHPFIAEMRRCIAETVRDRPKMTLKEFLSELDELILSDEVKMIREAEEAQLKDLFEKQGR